MGRFPVLIMLVTSLLLGTGLVRLTPLQSAARGTELLRIHTSSALFGATLDELVLESLRNGERLEGMGVDLPHCWTDAELSELQWPPLAKAARADHDRVLQLAERRPAGVSLQHFMETYDLCRCHALSCTIGDTAAGSGLWLVPEIASFSRCAPRGAMLRHSTAGTSSTDANDAAAAELVLVSDGSNAVSSGWRTNDQLLLSEGWADANLECDAVEIPETVLQQAADEELGRDAQLRATHAAVLDGLRNFGYLPAVSAEDAESGCTVLAGGLADDHLGRYLQV